METMKKSDRNTRSCRTKARVAGLRRCVQYYRLRPMQYRKTFSCSESYFVRFMMSNIADIFNPPASRPVVTDNCAPCTAVQALMCFGGGWYMLLGFPLQDKNGIIDVRKHPVWWQKSVRGVGVLLVGLGAYRVGELAQMAWHRYKTK